MCALHVGELSWHVEGFSEKATLLMEGFCRYKFVHRVLDRLFFEKLTKESKKWLPENIFFELCHTPPWSEQLNIFDGNVSNLDTRFRLSL